jgi:hypothetical protein
MPWMRVKKLTSEWAWIARWPPKQLEIMSVTVQMSLFRNTIRYQSNMPITPPSNVLSMISRLRPIKWTRYREAVRKVIEISIVMREELLICC